MIAKTVSQVAGVAKTDGIDFVGPFHPEVTRALKTKNAAGAAFNVF
jgi:hypothetical protein